MEWRLLYLHDMVLGLACHAAGLTAEEAQEFRDSVVGRNMLVAQNVGDVYRIIDEMRAFKDNRL